MPRMLNASRGLEHLWRVGEEHLDLIEDAAVDHTVRLFAIEVVVSALDHGPPERTLARTFEVLRSLVDRDDPLLGDLLSFLPDVETDAIRGALRRLAERAVERGNRKTITTVLWALVQQRVPVAARWMARLLELTPDAELERDFAYLFVDWSASAGVEPQAREAILAARDALRIACATLDAGDASDVF